MIKIGDTVARKSYAMDLIFEVTDLDNGIAILYGKTVRLIADAPIEDLIVIADDEVRKIEEEEDKLIEELAFDTIQEAKERFITGKILHFDGDERYMGKCLDLYKKFGLYAIGVSEKEQLFPKIILEYIQFFMPDIVVITGHDAYNKREVKEIDNYRNSKYFVEATKLIRKVYPVINQPIIISGACQSHFEALISSGANFASSPNRVNIKSIDPAIIAVKCATTPINKYIKVAHAIDKTSSKNLGLGGIESLGTMKTLYF